MIQKTVVYRSLLPRSPVIKFAIWFVAALTLLTLLFDSAYMAISFLMIIGGGLGVSIQNYRKWESAQLIPDLRKAQAIAAIQCSIGLTLITLVVVALIHGPSFLLLGATAIATSLGLTLTFSKPSAVFALFGCVLLITAAQQYIEFKKIGDWFFGNPFHIHEILGTLGFCLGVAAHVHFYRKATQQTDESEKHSVANPASLNSDTKSQAFCLAPCQKNFWHRASGVLCQMGTYQAKQGFLTLIAIVVGLSVFLYGSRSSDIYVGIFIAYAAMVIWCSPVVLFMSSLPKAYERAWILGIGSDRENTAKQLFKLSALHSVGVFVAVSIGLVIMLPVSTQYYTGAIVVLFAAFAAGTFSLWIASITAKYWYRHGHGYAAFLAFLLISTTTAALSVPSIERILDQLNSSHHFARDLSLGIGGCLLVSLLMWSLCFTIAAQCIGREPSLMER